MNTRLPRLLDKSLKEVRRLYPKSQSAEINLTPLSTASLTLEDASGVRVRDFIELYNSRGSAGIFRVKSPSAGYGVNTDTLSLEHGICVLGDAIIPGESTMTGTPLEVLTFIMNYQTAKVGGVPMWKLGAVEAGGTITYDFRNSNTLHALLDVVEKLSDYMLTFDQSGFPWVVSVVAMESTPSCEGRIGRNVVSARVTIDDSNLCTRVHSPRLPGGYLQLEDDPEWGVVEQPLDFDDEVPEATVIAECRKYIEARSEPMISVEIDGLDLAAQTGEALDRFEVGRMMRLALPRYGVVVNERITSISYSAMHDQPQTVRIYLANKLKDASTSIAGLSSGVTKLEGTTAAQARIIKVTEKSVQNLQDSADGFRKIDGKIVKWFSEVGINLDAEQAQVGIFAKYEETRDLFDAVSQRVGNAELILNGGDGASGLIDQMTEVQRIQGEDGILLAELDTWVGEAALILEGDGTSANAGLVARVKKNEEEVSKAAVTLYGDGTSAQAGLVAKFGEVEGELLLQATDIGTLFEVKADTTVVRDLVANRVDAEMAVFMEQIAGELNVANLTSMTFETGIAKTTLFTAEGQSNFNGFLYANAGMEAASVETELLTFKSNLIKLAQQTVLISPKNMQGFAVNQRDGSPATIYAFHSGTGTSNCFNTKTIYYLSWEASED